MSKRTNAGCTKLNTSDNFIEVVTLWILNEVPSEATRTRSVCRPVSYMWVRVAKNLCMYCLVAAKQWVTFFVFWMRAILPPVVRPTLVSGRLFFNLRNSLGWVQRYVLLDGDPITLSRGSCPCWFFFFFSCLQGLKNFYPRTGHSDNKHWLKKERQRQCIKKVGWARFGRFRWEKKDIYTLEHQLWWILIFSLFNLSSAVAGPTDSGGEVVVVVHADCG